MKLEKINQWLSLLANIGVVAGIVFLAVEIRTNTATNRIAIFQGSSSNWMQINGQLATDKDLATLLDKAFAGEELDNVETRQFNGWVGQQLTHAAFMHRLFDAGLLSEEEFRKDFSGIRRLARSPPFRDFIESMAPGRLRRLTLATEEEFDELIIEGE